MNMHRAAAAAAATPTTSVGYGVAERRRCARNGSLNGRPNLASTTPFRPDVAPVETPKTPKLVLRPEVTNRSPPAPDTEENVARQTGRMFHTFVVEMNDRECRGSGVDGMTSSGMAAEDALLSAVVGVETSHPVPDELCSPEERVGRQLAMIGDDVNARYANDFNKMVRLLRVDANTAYDGFACVARQLFSDGIINWGRIIVLLCFGYRVVVQVVRRGLSTMFARFFSFVVDFIIRENIAGWIAAQGGWMAALRYIPETVGWPTIGIVFSVAAIFVAAAVYISKIH